MLLHAPYVRMGSSTVAWSLQHFLELRGDPFAARRAASPPVLASHGLWSDGRCGVTAPSSYLQKHLFVATMHGERWCTYDTQTCCFSLSWRGISHWEEDGVMAFYGTILFRVLYLHTWAFSLRCYWRGHRWMHLRLGLAFSLVGWCWWINTVFWMRYDIPQMG